MGSKICFKSIEIFFSANSSLLVAFARSLRRRFRRELFQSFGIIHCYLIKLKAIRVYLLCLITLAYFVNLPAKAVEVDSALNKASSKFVGTLKNLNEAETLANSVSVVEPKSKLAHWLKAQSLLSRLELVLR